MLTHSFARMLVLATLIGALCGFVGMNLSYHLDIASGPTIVLARA
jgi:manganese/iron transport system permease protein/iron/zinc/copper transport system permease protein